MGGARYWCSASVAVATTCVSLSVCVMILILFDIVMILLLASRCVRFRGPEFIVWETDLCWGVVVGKFGL